MANFSVQSVPLMVLFLMGTQEAKAYVDPGSGSLLIQFVLAAAVGVLFQLRSTIARLRWWK